MAKEKSAITEAELGNAFSFFNEIGILSQLSKALFEKELPKGMQVIHFSVLNHLVRMGDGKLPSDMARAFQLPRSNMTDILTKLESQRLISTEVNPKDKRSKCINITEQGKEFRMDAIKRFSQPTIALAQEYDLGKMKQILPVLAELREVMDVMRDET